MAQYVHGDVLFVKFCQLVVRDGQTAGSKRPRTSAFDPGLLFGKVLFDRLHADRMAVLIWQVAYAVVMQNGNVVGIGVDLGIGLLDG